jgi:hypothetical protein
LHRLLQLFVSLLPKSDPKHHDAKHTSTATISSPCKWHFLTCATTLQAITAASVYNVTESQQSNSQQQQQQLQNILRTATAIVVACKTFDPDRRQRVQQRQAGEVQFDAATTAAVAKALTPGAPTPKPLRQLQELIQQQLNAAGGSAAADAAGTATNAAAAPNSAQGGGGGAAAAVLQVPRALELYLGAISDAAEVAAREMDGGDGSYESSLVGKFPLDGSAVAGGDLVRG